MRTKLNRKTLVISSISVEHEHDPYPDTSCIGEWTDKPDEWVIDRRSGEYIALLPDDYKLPNTGRKYRFFRPYAGGEKPGTTTYQEYGKRDWERLENLERGQWMYIGIVARAIIVVNGVTQALSSGGLWGVESDGGPEYLAEIRREEMGSLRTILQQLGFSHQAISAAFKKCQTR